MESSDVNVYKQCLSFAIIVCTVVVIGFPLGWPGAWGGHGEGEIEGGRACATTEWCGQQKQSWHRCFRQRQNEGGDRGDKKNKIRRRRSKRTKRTDHSSVWYLNSSVCVHRKAFVYTFSYMFTVWVTLIIKWSSVLTETQISPSRLLQFLTLSSQLSTLRR